MKNNYGRFKLIVLISLILLLFIITIEASAGNAPNSLENQNSQQEIVGIVTGPQGQPIAGVAVFIKGETKGTVTNLDGEYSIRATPGDILIFSYLGFKPVEAVLEQERNINIQMEEDVSFLGEVEINAGYYNTTRRESTGNISRVTAEEIELQPVVSPLQALQGRMAGVQIIPAGSQPGMAATIRIRGRNSLRDDGNFPLYIIDGVPINSSPIESNSLLGSPGPGIDPLNSLNLSSIESIEVLKDADATAIYGSRGANGVVLIATKKGMGEKTGLEARIYKGSATVPNRVDLLNTEEYLRIRRQAFINDGVEPTPNNAYDLTIWDQTRETDWQDFFFGGSSAITDVNLATYGGDENTSFRLGGGYHEQGTVYTGDFDYQKVTAALSLNHISENKKLAMNLSVNYGMDNNNLVGNVDLMYYAFTLPPNAPRIFNEDGSLHWDDWSAAGLNNPLEGFFNTSSTETNDLISNLGISYEILPGLTFKSNFGYTNFTSEEILKRPKRSYNPSNWETTEHGFSRLEVERNSWIAEPQVLYSRNFGRLKTSAILGGTFQESQFKSLSLQGKGFVSESLIGNLGAAESILNASNENTTYRYTAIFSRLGLNWDEKYILNLTGRRDGSSRFGPGKKFANFGAIGAAWVFSEEPFLRNKDTFLSFGKIRASYGTTGNDQIGDYGYLDAYEATPGPGGLYPTQLANQDYSWEVNKKLEAAVDFGFLKNNINLAISWYRNRSSNQLVGYVLPSTTGFTSIQANLPATVENTGWEVQISTFNLQSKDFQWESFFNLTLPKTELVSYPGIEQSSYANMYRVGHPLNISLLYQYDGIDPETGYYSIADVNEDGSFDYEDRVVIQDMGREFYGGISNNISYKAFSLQFLLEFAKQEGTLGMLGAGFLSNQRVEVLEALEDNSRYQRISASPQAEIAYSRMSNTSFTVVDASYVRLKTLALNYSIPTGFMNSIGFEQGKIFLTGQNLYTYTSYEGLDPEMPNEGISFAGLRTIAGGAELKF